MSRAMKPVAILGAGNIGTAIAEGIVDGGHATPAEVVLTRRKRELLQRFADRGLHRLKGIPDQWQLFAVQAL